MELSCIELFAAAERDLPPLTKGAVNTVGVTGEQTTKGAVNIENMVGVGGAPLKAL